MHGKNPEIDNPFKGPIPYLQGDTIYGRENEVIRLFDLVTSNTLTILYSKSGYGKTSLIQAGLMPLLAKNLVYLPVYIRLNTVDVNSIDALQMLIVERIKALQDSVTTALQDTATISKTKGIIEYDKEKTKNSKSLFEFLYLLNLKIKEELIVTPVAAKEEIAPPLPGEEYTESAVVSIPENGENISLANAETQGPAIIQVSNEAGDTSFIKKEKDEFEIIPVLIFDQFEEIFTILAEEKTFRTQLLTDLECLLENKIHKSLASRMEREFKKDKSLLFNLTERIASREKPFRIIISFREEFRLQFDRLSYRIPTINFTNARLELGAFNKAEAKDLIIKISAHGRPEDDKGIIKEDVAENLSCILELAAEKDELFNNNKNISPFILSLICFKCYTKIILEDREILSKIKATDKSLINNLVEEYYVQVFTDISKETVEFVQDNLIKEKSRNPFPYKSIKDPKILEEINSLSGITPDNKLENPDIYRKRYLTKSQYLSASYVEILHDQLTPPIIARKKIRTQKKEILDREKEINDRISNEKNKSRKRKFTRNILIAVGIILILIAIKIYSDYKTIDFVYSTTIYKEPQVLKNLEDNYGTYLSFIEALGYDSLVRENLETNAISSLNLGYLHLKRSFPLEKTVDSFLTTQFRKELYFNLYSVQEDSIYGQPMYSNGHLLCKLNRKNDSLSVIDINSMLADTVISLSTKSNTNTPPIPATVSANYLASQQPGILMGEKFIAVKSDSILFIYDIDHKKLSSINIPSALNLVLEKFSLDEKYVISSAPSEMYPADRNNKALSKYYIFSTANLKMAFQFSLSAYNNSDNILNIVQEKDETAVYVEKIQSQRHIIYKQPLTSLTQKNLFYFDDDHPDDFTTRNLPFLGINILNTDKLAKPNNAEKVIYYKSKDVQYIFKRKDTLSDWAILDLRRGNLLENTSIPRTIKYPVSFFPDIEKNISLVVSNNFEVTAYDKNKQVLDTAIKGFTKNDSSQYRIISSVYNSNIKNYLVVNYVLFKPTGSFTNNYTYIGLLKYENGKITWMDLDNKYFFSYNDFYFGTRITVEIKNTHFAIVNSRSNSKVALIYEPLIWILKNPAFKPAEGYNLTTLNKWYKQQQQYLLNLSPDVRKLDSLKIQYPGFEIKN